MAIRKYRVNADRWTDLADILCGIPEDFNSDRDSLRGRTERYAMTGRLPNAFLRELQAAQDEDRLRYVIYSYGTPIAWCVAEDWSDDHATYSKRWVMPDTKYSVTTSKHQGKVRTALHNISGGL